MWCDVVLFEHIRAPLLGLPLLFLDGRFHFTTPLERLQVESPDWIIARNGLGLQHAFSEEVHKVLGISLMTSSMYVFYDRYLRKNNHRSITAFSSWYLKFVLPATLGIIATAITLKQVYGKDTLSPTAFLA